MRAKMKKKKKKRGAAPAAARDTYIVKPSCGSQGEGIALFMPSTSATRRTASLDAILNASSGDNGDEAISDAEQVLFTYYEEQLNPQPYFAYTAGDMALPPAVNEAPL